MFLFCGSQVADKQDPENLVVSVFASKAEVAVLDLHAELLNLKESRSSVSAVTKETNYLLCS